MAAPAPTPAPTAPPVAAPPLADTSEAAAAPASSDAVIVFTNTPDARCRACETLKITVTPSGTVLMERGEWLGDHRNWRYKRSVAHVGPARAAQFAASLSGDRPVGDQLLISGPTCPGPASEDDGLVIEWIDADQHDQLTFNFRCPARRDSPVAERLRRAPDLLGVSQIVFPWNSTR